ncbi:hypothetical protein PG1C_10005 [Rugosibacter aromaticivorans]|uniref:Uncharacterized protein n=1 Tax=Rugosibacter aromaticivorans TaxID=1565605 RepID=A0A0C5J9S1_9PROT|nr:hypothetical protein [Rugosibacter aromaticivorans]AJP48680.1 hypothetical protein PG1C_10005 [Rugosibacter aromaticivorans]
MSSRAVEKSALMTRRPWATGSVLLLAFLLWLLNHPYQGIWHDARVYGLIAAHWIYPEALASDLFFRFGSQGSLSLFTPIYGALVRVLGLDVAARLVVLSGGALWVAALFALARAMLGDTLAGRFAVLFGVMLSVSYSPNASIFVLNENFATARVWAMPCGVLAVALLINGRRITAAGLALLAFLLHPLLGIWPLALLAVERLSLRLLLVLACVPTLAVLVIGSVGGLDISGLRLIDGALLEFVQNAPDIIFKPGASRLPFHLMPLAILLLGTRAGSPYLRPLYARLFLIGGVALLLALVASDFFPLEIVVQGQPWRVTWLALPVSGMALLDVLQTLHRASPVRFAVPWLCGLLLALVTLGVVSTPWGLVALSVVVLAASFLPPRFFINAACVLQTWRRSALIGLIALWCVALPGLWTELEIVGARFVGAWWHGAVALHGLVAGGIWLLPLLLAAGIGWLAKWRVAAPLAVVILGGVIAVTLAQWDWRNNAQRSEEARWLNPHAAPHPFARFIQPTETIAWPEKETTVWFVLHTANYVGEIQHIGVVFSRDKFMEWRRRDAFLKQVVNLPEKRLALCGDPVVDWVVMPQPVAGVAAVAVLPGAALYACTPLRAVSLARSAGSTLGVPTF